MKRVDIFVEGSSDKFALQTLLHPLIQSKQNQNVFIEFFPTGGKHGMMKRSPAKALNILRNEPDRFVCLLPDLYPVVSGYKTFSELKNYFFEKFHEVAESSKIKELEPFEKRFHVFCLKHDLEVLLLAASDKLQTHLGLRKLKTTWTIPVEDQNQDQPPVRIVERIFEEAAMKYIKETDAELILSGENYSVIAEKCPQCFKPFVDFLESL